MPALSVLICTHNPRPDYLRRVLDALRAQTLPLDQWELLLIDNASREPLSSIWDLSWHPSGRHVREENLGANHARMRAIRESAGELLVYVDDDNLVAPDYLENAASIIRSWPQLGAIGASITAEYEVPAPTWIKRYLEHLAVHELQADAWSNLPVWSLATPYGAGMCFRRCVADDYINKVAAEPLRKQLGRTGNSMVAGEDIDLGRCALDLGLGTGRFVALKLTHLISQDRLTENYVIRLMAGIAATNEILLLIHPSGRPRPFWKRQLLFIVEMLRADRLQRRILFASAKSRAEVLRRLKQSPESAS
jgi:hypothetical protein